LKAYRKKRPEPVERDERLYDEKVRLVRPGRLIAGIAMIGVAIIWLAVENIVSPAAPQPRARATATVELSAPRIAVAQSFAGGMADVVVQARPKRLNGRPAPPGSSYLVVAVQVVNRTSAPLLVAVSDFTITTDARKGAYGTAPAGHDAVFSRTGIPPKATAEGDINFTVPNTASSTAIVYVPRVQGAKPLRWSVSGDG
jgi:hypothetical protein